MINVGTGVETSVNRLYELVAAACGTPRAARRGPAKSGEQMRSVLDVTKSRTALGLTALVALPDGLSRTAAWFVRRPPRPDARRRALSESRALTRRALSEVARLHGAR